MEESDTSNANAAEWTGTQGFPDYVPTTRDAGPWILVAVCVYSILMLCFIPPLLVIGRRWEITRRRAKLARLQRNDRELMSHCNSDESNSNQGNDCWLTWLHRMKARLLGRHVSHLSNGTESGAHESTIDGVSLITD